MEAPDTALATRLIEGGELTSAQLDAALEVYQRALEKAGTLDPKKVRDAIAATNIMTMYGPIRFNEKGQNIAKGMSVVQVQNGKAVVVYPLEGAQAKFIYPIAPR